MKPADQVPRACVRSVFAIVAFLVCGCGSDDGNGGGPEQIEAGGAGCYFPASNVCETYADPDPYCLPTVSEAKECATANLEGVCSYRDSGVGRVLAHYYQAAGMPWSHDGLTAAQDCASYGGTFQRR